MDGCVPTQDAPRAIGDPAMQNIEFKADLRDIELARLICRRCGARYVDTVEQADTYYRVADGRLKKRETADEPAEFIFYHRINRARPKLSHFTIYSEQEARARFGERPLPIWVSLRKKREIYMRSGVQIHLDSVEHLGTFFEAEALVMPSQHIGRCHALITEVRGLFIPALGEPVATSYSDMMALELETSA